MAKVSTSWVLKLFDKVSQPMRNIKKNTDAATKSGNRLGDCFKRIRAIDFYAVGQGIQSLNQQLQQAIQPGVDFQKNLSELSALTGVSGEALEDLGRKARDSALIFGGSASDSLNTYKTILSRLGPDIAKTPAALGKMEKNVRTLSKTMGGDAKGAVDALTTAMLQYGVDLSDPIEAQKKMADMMNVMAAGAQQGAAEVPKISQALKVAGVQSKQSGLSFEETNAALQALAKGGLEGSEAGTALRNVLAKTAGADVIPKDALEKLQSLGVNMDIVSDKTRPFSERLGELKKAQSDATAVAQLFGIENATSAQILLDSIGDQKKLEKQITSTSSATEQSSIVMDSYAEKMSRLNAWFKDLGISVFNATKKMMPFIDVMGKVAFTGSQIGTVFSGLGPVLKGFGSKTIRPLIRRLGKLSLSSLTTAASVDAMGVGSVAATPGIWSLTGSIKALSKAIYSIPVVGWILAIIGALVALFTYLWNNSEKFRGFIYGIWNVIKLVFGKIVDFVKPILRFFIEGFKNTFKGIWTIVKSVVTTLWGFIKTAFQKIKSIIGKVLGTIKTVFKSVFGSVYNAVVNVFKKIWKKVKHYMDKILGPIKKAGKIVKGLWSKIFGKDFSGEVSEAMEKGRKRAKREFGEKDGETPKGADDSSGLKGLVSKFLSGNQDANPSKDGLSNRQAGQSNDKGLSVSGGGAAKGAANITMTINNNFSVDKDTNVKSLADKVAGAISDRLQDALVTI